MQQVACAAVAVHLELLQPAAEQEPTHGIPVPPRAGQHPVLPAYASGTVSKLCYEPLKNRNREDERREGMGRRTNQLTDVKAETGQIGNLHQGEKQARPPGSRLSLLWNFHLALGEIPFFNQ